MPSKIPESSPMYLERYEMKFLIPADLIADIEQFVAPYCCLDPFCEKTPTAYYRINSLYVDSHDSLFYHRRRSGSSNRFNMRIRSYGHQPVAPYFLEVKHKYQGFVKKYRAKVFSDDLYNQIFTASPSTDHNLALFQGLAITHGIEPKIMTSYDRKALVSVVDDYARVTFDRNLKVYQTNDFSVKPEPAREINYDNETLFPPDCNVILEMKSTVRVPLWMIDVINYFELRRTSFSKFSNSFEEVSRQASPTLMDRVAHFAGQ